MKKNILLQLLFLLSFSLTCVAQADRSKITYKLTIASPQRDCDGGLGICITFNVANKRQVDAGITSKENHIQFQLHRSTMNESLEKELLHLLQFSIEEETQLPMDIANKIGLTREVTIIPGRYPIEISDDYITITCAIE
ncbi:MAG: hypothetical protein IPO63_04380 [Bacteroidetes bacterium]|nr:hypothetical protein [Bacteroidota bacterium]